MAPHRLFQKQVYQFEFGVAPLRCHGPKRMGAQARGGAAQKAGNALGLQPRPMVPPVLPQPPPRNHPRNPPAHAQDFLASKGYLELPQNLDVDVAHADYVHANLPVTDRWMDQHTCHQVRRGGAGWVGYGGWGWWGGRGRCCGAGCHQVRGGAGRAGY